MKKLVAVLFFVTCAATGAYAMGSNSQPAPSNQSQGNAPKPASFNDEDTLLHRPTPAPDATPANPKEKKPLTASLGKDNTGKNSVTAFASMDPKIYLVWKEETGVKGQKIRIAWFAEDTGGVISKNKKLTEATQVVPGPGSFGSSYLVMPSGGFPAGKYRVEVSEDGKLAKSLKFTVKK